MSDVSRFRGTLPYASEIFGVYQPLIGWRSRRKLIRIGNDFLMSGEWWITIFPGAALVAMVLSVNLLGDWLRDALNPRLR